MQLAIIYNSYDNKLLDNTYSYIYRGLFNALVSKFDTKLITVNCNAKDIEADVILFYDINSHHDIRIDGIEKHPALKLEYMSDPHQKEFFGRYISTGREVHKLSAEQRIRRAFGRGGSQIICPYKAGYYRYLAPVIGKDAEEMLWYFPHSPWFKTSNTWKDRKIEVLGNGATWDGGVGMYQFRKWAYEQPQVTYVPHVIKDKGTPSGKNYGEFLVQWAGSLALNEFFPINKYFEIPMAGCVTFAQWHREYEDLGFVDYETCVYVNKENFIDRIDDFTTYYLEYEHIAKAGKELMEQNYTADHFADFVYNKVKEKIDGK